MVGGTTWPYVLLGTAYIAVALALTLAGGIRQRRVRAALRRDSFDELGDRWIAGFTAAGALLALATLAIVVIGP